MACPHCGGNTGHLPQPPGGGGVSLSNDTPAAPGTAAAGVAATASRSDHVHAPLWRTPLGDWFGANQAASSTKTLVRPGAAAAAPTNNVRKIPYACTITQIDFVADQNTAGSALICRVVVNGVAVTAAGSILTVSVGVSKASQFLSTPIAVAAGDEIGMETVSDGSWTATTLDPVCGLWGSGSA